MSQERHCADDEAKCVWHLLQNFDCSQLELNVERQLVSIDVAPVADAVLGSLSLLTSCRGRCEAGEMSRCRPQRFLFKLAACLRCKWLLIQAVRGGCTGTAAHR